MSQSSSSSDISDWESFEGRNIFASIPSDEDYEPDTTQWEPYTSTVDSEDPPDSPLPSLIIEREKKVNLHDDSEEYYAALKERMLILYRKWFIEEDSSYEPMATSSVDETNRYSVNPEKSRPSIENVLVEEAIEEGEAVDKDEKVASEGSKHTPEAGRPTSRSKSVSVPRDDQEIESELIEIGDDSVTEQNIGEQEGSKHTSEDGRHTSSLKNLSVHREYDQEVDVEIGEGSVAEQVLEEQEVSTHTPEEDRPSSHSTSIPECFRLVTTQADIHREDRQGPDAEAAEESDIPMEEELEEKDANFFDILEESSSVSVRFSYEMEEQKMDGRADEDVQRQIGEDDAVGMERDVEDIKAGSTGPNIEDDHVAIHPRTRYSARRSAETSEESATEPEQVEQMRSTRQQHLRESLPIPPKKRSTIKERRRERYKSFSSITNSTDHENTNERESNNFDVFRTSTPLRQHSARERSSRKRKAPSITEDRRSKRLRSPTNIEANWNVLKKKIFAGNVRSYRLCRCTNHSCTDYDSDSSH